jgi:DNA-directed RNA polymerase specialized sigma24 family protein
VDARFDALLDRVEAPLRRALVAAYGADAGRDAAAEALGWAWEHLDRVSVMANPGGYLWRVGQTAARRGRDRASLVAVPERGGGSDLPDVEPALRGALAGLSPQQRAAVLLVHGWGYGLTEAAAAMGCRLSTLRNHLARGMTKLRADLGVTVDGR